MYEINKEIVFSTAHITKEENTLMSGMSNCIDQEEYGWRIFIGDDVEPLLNLRDEEIEVVPNVMNLAQIAKEQGCKWLVLDYKIDFEKEE